VATASDIVFTAIQQRMIAVLSDGRPHTRKELHACLWDEKAKLSSICFHLSLIRSKLRTQGQDILCEWYNKSFHYRHVRLLSGDDE
jgi:hypothetical protein